MKDKKMTMLFVAAMVLLAAAIIVIHLPDASVDGADKKTLRSRFRTGMN